MKQEAAQKFIDRQSGESLPIAVGGISPAEGNVAVGESTQPVVRDGDAMGVSAEIAQGVFRSPEGPLGVDNPVMAKQESEPGGEGPRFCQGREAAVELECAFAECALKSGDELTPKDPTEYLDGKEEGAA